MYMSGSFHDGQLKCLLTMILNGLCSAIVLLPTALCYFGIIQPYRYGFSCDDLSIRQPFIVESISSKSFLLYGILFTTTFIALVEQIRYLTNTSHREYFYESRCTFQWRLFVQHYYGFIQGVVLCLAVTQCAKLSIGGLRPHFIDRCQPVFDKNDCSSNSSSRHVTNYTCTKDISIDDLANLYQTFPSGHAIAAVYSSVYLCIYLNKRLFGWPSIFMSSVVQSALLIVASFICASRLKENLHHPSDIIAGSIVGLIIACYNAMWLWTSNPEFEISYISKPPVDTKRETSDYQ